MSSSKGSPIDDVIRSNSRMMIVAEASEALEDIASSSGRYFSCLVRRGFTREEAMALVIEWQRALFRNAGRQRDAEE